MGKEEHNRGSNLCDLWRKCVCLNDNEGVPTLYCTQEEADNRMILHAHHASDRYRVSLSTHLTLILLFLLKHFQKILIPKY